MMRIKYQQQHGLKFIPFTPPSTPNDGWKGGGKQNKVHQQEKQLIAHQQIQILQQSLFLQLIVPSSIFINPITHPPLHLFFPSFLFIYFLSYIYSFIFSIMLKVSHIVAKQLISKNTFRFAGLSFGKKREKVKNDLPKYDLVIAGGHLGAVLSNHFDAAVGEKASIFIAFDNPYYQYNVLRSFYEQGSFAKFDMTGNSRTSMNKFAVSSDGQGVVKFNPQNNEIVLKNGRVVQYDQLVIATGMENNYQSIKGFEEAWADLDCPFHTNQDHPTWKNTDVKFYRYQYNFMGGDAIFYIPPAPFHGQIENYNFLLSKAMWDRLASHGRLSWANSRFTIINANDTFCQHYNKADVFIRSQLEKNKINLEQGLKLIQVNKEQQTAIFQNVSTGQLEERPFQSFYSLMPAKPQDNLAEAGLADHSGFLNVDPQTLQHKKYNNIFGLGDVNNVPTTKTFYGGFDQLHVVRNNLEKQMNGLPLNAKYDGTSSALFHTGMSEIASFKHNYNGGDGLDSGMMASLRFKKFNMLGKKEVMNICKFKNFGPPYYKWKKTFSGEGVSQGSSPVQLHPEKKTA